MPNRFFEITIRPNWQKIDRCWAARSAKLCALLMPPAKANTVQISLD